MSILEIIQENWISHWFFNKVASLEYLTVAPYNNFALALNYNLLD